MNNEGMTTVYIQDISTSPQCIQQTETDHKNQEETETLADRIKIFFKSILCGNKPELTTNLKVEVSEQDNFQVRMETDKTSNEVNVFVTIPRYFHFQRFESSYAAKCFDAVIFRDLSNPKTIQTSGNHVNNLNVDRASKPRDDGHSLTLTCDLIAANLTKTQASDETYAPHTHEQSTLELLKDVENLENHVELISELPPSDRRGAKNNINASAQLQLISNHIADATYQNQLPVLDTEYAQCKKYFSDIDSESDIKDSEDCCNQQNQRILLQRNATAERVLNDSINLNVIDAVNHTQLLPDMDLYHVGLESDEQRSSIQSDDSTASALTELIKNESDLYSPVTKVHSLSKETCVQSGIPLKKSTFVFKRNTKATQEVKFCLFGNNCNQLYTRSAALTKFQNYAISTKDFKIMKFLRRDFDDIIEIFENQEPYEGKINDLIQILKQLESETSQQIQVNVPFQPSEFDSKLGSSSSLTVDKWTDKVLSQSTNSSERAEFTSFAENKTESLGTTSLGKTNTSILKETTRFSGILTKTEPSENISSTKELTSDSEIRKSISKSSKVSSTHRKSNPMLTSRTKMVDAKVKKTSKYKAPKFNIFTTLDDDKTGISTVLRDDILRQAMYGWFNNETKVQLQRPSIPWPSMHPLLPYKLRYLDEGLVDTPVVKTSSSPNDSTDETE